MAWLSMADQDYHDHEIAEMKSVGDLPLVVACFLFLDSVLAIWWSLPTNPLLMQEASLLTQTAYFIVAFCSSS